MLLRMMVCLLLALAAPVVAQAQEAAQADPFASAAEKSSVALYRPGFLPDGFSMGGVQLVTGPDELVVADYFSEGSSLHIMQSAPEGLECSDCPTTDVNGVSGYYEILEDAEAGMKVVTLTWVQDSTGISLALVGEEDQPVQSALDVLKKVAAGMELVASPGGVSANSSPEGALKDAADRAGFPVYVPSWLPQYFVLDSVAYAPEGMVEEEGKLSPEQVTLVYKDSIKQVRILIQAAGTLALPTGTQVKTTRVQNWPSALRTGPDNPSLTLNAPDASLVLAGNVQPETLTRMAQSLKRVAGQ